MTRNQTPDPEADSHLCPAGNVIRLYSRLWCLWCAGMEGAVDIVTHEVLTVDMPADPWPLDAEWYEEDGYA